MRLPIFLFALVSSTLAQTQNAEEGVQRHIKYDEPDGLKVNWKYFGQSQQWQRQLEPSQREERAPPHIPQLPHLQQPPRSQIPSHSQLIQPQVQPQQQAIPQQHAQVAAPRPQAYQPYSSVPNHIKQLLTDNYGEQQRPYIDPSSFVYDLKVPDLRQHQQQDQQSSLAEVDSRYELPAPRYRTAADSQGYQQTAAAHGKVDYAEHQQQRVQRITIPVEHMPQSPPPTLYLDKNMPSELRQLLQYQARLPYDVIANRITYKPKSLFIPKPISDEDKGAYNYRSKVYYVKNDNYEQYQNKPVVEEQ